jgi:hypothetical protein
MPRKASRLIAVALACLPACGGNNSSNSPTSPSASAATTGIWTGTITRPGGLAPITVRWEVTSNSGGLTGKMTLTNGGATATTTATGNTAGNDKQGYTIHMSFSSNPGDNAGTGFPNCTILGSTIGPQTGEPFPSPYANISVPAFQINYNSCRGFIDTGYSDPLANFLQETIQLTLHKP